MRNLLDAETRKILTDYLSKMESEVELVVILDHNSPNCVYCKDIQQLFTELAELDIPKLKITIFDKYHPEFEKRYGIRESDVPAIVFVNNNIKGQIVYRGVPSEQEFSVFIETILEVSLGHIHIPQEQIEKLNRIDKKIKINVYVTPTCPYCPTAVAMAFATAMVNPNLSAHAVEVTEFQEEGAKYNIRAVPTIVINDGAVKFEGALPLDRFIAKIEEAAKK
ncbi:MAG: thioredoxin family protein [Candidatus Anstonellales archaeon]